MEKVEQLSKQQIKQLSPEERASYRERLQNYKKALKEQSKREQQRIREEIQANLRFGIRGRNLKPQQVSALLGPTNSGKTYQALQKLLERGSGTYAAPLRMLAREAYESLQEQLGDQVGLITGEEKINPEAPILCTTTEMAPLQGDMLVLDEVHWAADPQRGWAWTRLLIGAEYKQLVLMGSVDVLPLLQSCFGEDLQVQIFERLGNLIWDRGVSISKLEGGDAVVVYSRKTALYLAKQLTKQYGSERVAVLYGSMPLESRLTELDRLRSGSADLLVCTDVVGHGLNLPIRRIVFAETSKYDGQKRRNLKPWEVAQIAGRAGRYLNHPEGFVAYLTSSKWYQPDPGVIQRGLSPTVLIDEEQQLYGFRRVSRALIRPSLSDLGPVKISLLHQAIEQWYKTARQELRSASWIDLEQPQEILGRLRIVRRTLRKSGQHLDLEQVWTLMHSPLNSDNSYQAQLLSDLTNALVGKKKLSSYLSVKIGSSSLEDAEQIAAGAAALRWFVGCFGEEHGVGMQQAANLEAKASRRVEKLLPQTIINTPDGCQSCGAECAPWFDFCYGCAFGYDDYW